MDATSKQETINNIQAVFPAEMLRPPQWIRWHQVLKPGDKKPTKIPDDPNATGEEAKTNDPETWASFDQAARRYIAADTLRGGGVGFVFTEADPYAGIDLDYCRDPETGEISPRAQRIIDAANTYTEVSPSGTGVKLYGLGELPGHRGYHPRESLVEIYDAGRWFAVTGEHVEGTPNEARDMQHVINAVLADSRAKGNGTRNGAEASLGSDGGDYPEPFDLARALVGVPEGERDNTLWSMAGKLRRENCPQSWAETAILTAAANCTPPFDPDLALDKVRRAYREYEPVEPSANGHGGEISQNRESYPEPGRPLTDLGNAERLAKRIRGDVLYVYSWDSFLAWDGKRYVPNATGYVEREAKAAVRAIPDEATGAHESEAKDIQAHAKRSEAHGRIRAAVELVKSEPGIEAVSEDLDSDRYLLNVANGTLDLRDGTLRPHDPADRITKLAPVQWDPDAKAPLFAAFLERVIPAPEVRAYLQRLMGYALTGEVREEVMAVMYGTGANGKTTLINTVLAALGDYAIQAAPELLVAKKGRHPTEIADLFGARFVASVEIEEGQRLDESLVKYITGRDRIKARKMRQDFWEFDPTHTVFTSVNHKPVIRGTDRGIWRRVKLIPFEVEIPEAEQNTKLEAELRAELPGVLRWLVEGCLAWQRGGGLETPDAVTKATDRYKMAMDTFGAFLDEATKQDPSEEEEFSRLYSAYEVWCKHNGEYALKNRAFSQRLEDRGFPSHRGAKGKRMRLGLSLTDEWHILAENHQTSRVSL